MSIPLSRELAGLRGLGRNLATGAGLFSGFELFSQGQSGSPLDKAVQNLPGIIPDPRTDAGRNAGRVLGNEIQYGLNQLRQGKIPYYGNVPAQAPRSTGSLRNYGTGYKQKELAAGAAAEAFRPGAGFPGQQTSAPPAGSLGSGSLAPLDPYAAQNREYERERARVEAMVKANPDMQKQAIADERAKVRDQGMAIWAAKHGGLAKNVKPGAVGYDAIQRAIGIQELPPLENQAEFTWNQATQGSPTASLMPSPAFNPAGPNFIGGEGPRVMNFADPRFENMSPEEFQKLLNQAVKK